MFKSKIKYAVREKILTQLQDKVPMLTPILIYEMVMRYVYVHQRTKYLPTLILSPRIINKTQRHPRKRGNFVRDSILCGGTAHASACTELGSLFRSVTLSRSNGTGIIAEVTCYFVTNANLVF